jgi:hypothetical protein
MGAGAGAGAATATATPSATTATGSWGRPFVVETFPVELAGDTRTSDTREADAYLPCAPDIPEAGAEVVYELRPPGDGVLAATLDDAPGDDVDIDLHLLREADPATCLARANVTLRWPVSAGVPVFLVLDTWSGGAAGALAGPYHVDVTLAPPGGAGDCPAGMVPADGFCIDRYEAPGAAGALPLVMYTFDEADAWCAARGRRLCYDDEWTRACAGVAATRWPYGDVFRPGACRDDATWRPYDQTLLNGWPWGRSGPAIDSLDALLAAVAAASPTARAAAEHVRALYQGTPAGDRAGCTNETGAFDLTGNVEEWTRRRDAGDGPQFSGALKGRYWAEARTCQSAVTNHGNAFRFYEIGFRCCLDRPDVMP